LTEILTQREIDALIEGLTAGDVRADEARIEDRPVRLYDFRRPDKFSKDQIRTMQMLHDNVARMLTTYFSANFRTMVQFTVESVDQLTFGEFIRAVPNPAVTAVVGLAPLEGNAIIEIQPSIAFPMVDRLFGGLGQGQEKARALTEIEETAIERVVRGILANLADGWKNIVELRPKLEAVESNPLFIQVVSPSDSCIVISLSARIGDQRGAINVCIPYVVLEPVLPRLSVQQWFAATKRETPAHIRDSLRRRLGQVMVSIRAELGRTEITVRDLLNLEVGDVVPLDSNLDDEVSVFVEDEEKFRGRPGTVSNRLAVQVTEVVSGGEEG